MSGRLIVLSGPSGVGKDTVLERLLALEPGIRYSVSYTTRPPRPGEVDGTSYSFVDLDTFRDMEVAGAFLETATVHGHLYGTAAHRVEEAVARGDRIVLKIDVQGAAAVRARVPDAVLVFLLPPSVEELQARLRARETEDAASLARRQADAVRELAEAERYDHRVVNDDVERAAREILAIIAGDRGARPGRGSRPEPAV